MNENISDFSDEQLNAFVDGELEWHERDRIFKAMEQNPPLVQYVCELHHMKELVKHSLVQPGDPPLSSVQVKKTHRSSAAVLSTVLLVALAGIGGFYFSKQGAHGAPSASASQFVSGNLSEAFSTPEAARAPHRVLVHISDVKNSEIDRVLDQTEQLLRESRAAGDVVEIELVANGQGLSILEKGSRVGQRLLSLKAQYSNLKLFACSTTVQRRKENGTPVALLPDVDANNAAVDLIVARLKQGWFYFRT